MGGLTVSQLCDLIHELLHQHETSLSIRLLRSLGRSQIGLCIMPFDSGEFSSFLDGFVESAMKDNPYGTQLLVKAMQDADWCVDNQSPTSPGISPPSSKASPVAANGDDKFEDGTSSLSRKTILKGFDLGGLAHEPLPLQGSNSGGPKTLPSQNKKPSIGTNGASNENGTSSAQVNGGGHTFGGHKAEPSEPSCRSSSDLKSAAKPKLKSQKSMRFAKDMEEVHDIGTRSDDMVAENRTPSAPRKSNFNGADAPSAPRKSNFNGADFGKSNSYQATGALDSPVMAQTRKSVAYDPLSGNVHLQHRNRNSKGLHHSNSNVSEGGEVVSLRSEEEPQELNELNDDMDGDGMDNLGNLVSFAEEKKESKGHRATLSRKSMADGLMGKVKSKVQKKSVFFGGGEKVMGSSLSNEKKKKRSTMFGGFQGVLRRGTVAKDKGADGSGSTLFSRIMRRGTMHRGKHEQEEEDSDSDEDGGGHRDSVSSVYSSESSHEVNLSSAQLARFGKLGARLTLSDENAPLLARPTGWWIIHPNHVPRVVWDIGSLVLIIAESVLVPLSVGFEVMPPTVWLHLVTVFFGIDIILTCITGFIVDGILCMRQSMILKRYLSTFFLIDFISTFPWEYALQGDGEGDQASTDAVKISRILKLVRLARLLRLIRLKAILSRLEDLVPELVTELHVGITLIKMLSVFGLLLHWAACFWGFLGSPERMGHSSADLPPIDLEQCAMGGACEHGVRGSPWMRRYSLENMGVEVQYLAALQVATGLITGGEWGMTAGHSPEIIYVVLMMVAGVLVCSMVLSQIVVVAQKVSQDSDEFRDNMRATKEFMASRKVPLSLQTKIKRYMQFQHRLKKQSVLDRHSILRLISPWLQLELTEHLNSKVMMGHPFFKDLSPMVFKRMCSLAKVVLYAEGDVVAQRGHRATCMFFVVQGRLRVIRVSRTGPVSRSTQQRNSTEAEEAEKTDENGNQKKPTLSRHRTNIAVRAAKDEAHEEDAKEASVLEPRSWVGDLCLFKDFVRANTIVAIVHSELLTIGKEEINDMLVEFPGSKKVYEGWRKRVGGESSAGGVRCEHCNGLGHSQENCPQLAKEEMAGSGNPEAAAAALWASRGNGTQFGNDRSTTSTGVAISGSIGKVGGKLMNGWSKIRTNVKVANVLGPGVLTASREANQDEEVRRDSFHQVVPENGEAPPEDANKEAPKEASDDEVVV